MLPATAPQGAGRPLLLARRPPVRYGSGVGRRRRCVEQLIHARRQAIRRVAVQHEVDGIRWWPPTAAPRWLDFLVEGVPGSLPAFRADLERALGCRVAIYLADQMPAETRRRVATETMPL